MYILCICTVRAYNTCNHIINNPPLLNININPVNKQGCFSFLIKFQCLSQKGIHHYKRKSVLNNTPNAFRVCDNKARGIICFLQYNSTWIYITSVLTGKGLNSWQLSQENSLTVVFIDGESKLGPSMIHKLLFI